LSENPCPFLYNPNRTANYNLALIPNYFSKKPLSNCRTKITLTILIPIPIPLILNVLTKKLVVLITSENTLNMRLTDQQLFFLHKNHKRCRDPNDKTREKGLKVFVTDLYEYKQ